MRWSPVRHLHPGDDYRRRQPSSREPAANRSGRTERLGGESLPLYRLFADFRGCDERQQAREGRAMRAYLPGYELCAPKTLAEALERMASEPGQWQPLAGGTDLMVLLQAGKLNHRRFFSIWRLPELRGISLG